MSDSHPTDVRLLDEIQSDFPVVARPYAELARRLDVRERVVLDRIATLRAEGIIRQIGAIFDTRHLGYRSSLVAAKVPAARIDEAACVFSSHPGVSHNYLREHDFNIWFTVAVPPDSTLGLDRTIELLGELANVESIRALPTLRTFRIGVQLDVTGTQAPGARRQQPVDGAREPVTQPLDERDRDAIRALQLDLPAESRPFLGLAERFGFDEAELLERAHTFLKTGQMRRFAGVLAHRKAGFGFNGMGVWAAPEDRVEELGSIMGSFAGVSHCYRRPTYPDWPYNLFSMTHGRTKDDCEAILKAISEETGLIDYRVLYSVREFKKVRVRYFTPEVYRWEDAHAELLV